MLALLRDIPREDLIIFVTAHIEPYEVNGETNWRMKTNGQKLTKLNLNSRLNYNLYTHIEHNPVDNTSVYSLITQSDGKTEARSSYGVLPPKMPNDLEEVRQLVMKAEAGE